MRLNESIIEDAALEWFPDLGYAVAPGEPTAQRDSFGGVVLVGRLREAIRRLNGSIQSLTFATLRDTRLSKPLSGESNGLENPTSQRMTNADFVC